jgi:hypothetical protein
VLPPGVHDIWVRRDASGPWRVQLMLDEQDGEDWVYRRDGRIRMTREELTWQQDGVAYIRPEVQLLYKSRGRRAKDETDFAMIVPLLNLGQREWLRGALELSDSANPWLASL